MPLCKKKKKHFKFLMPVLPIIYFCRILEEKVPPKPYVYEYGGVDYNGQGFHKAESQDEYGVVTGNPFTIYMS